MKKGDFIKIAYSGKTKDGLYFDSTIEQVAKENHIYNKNVKYGPVIVKLGERQLLPGLDDALEGKSIGKHEIALNAENAFGKKSAKLLRLVPTSVLNKNKINPYVGLELEIQGQRGIVRVASSGRTIVDFNHPLSGLSVIYEVEIIEIVKDDIEKTLGMLSLLNIKNEGVEKTESTIIIKMKELPQKEILNYLTKQLESLVGSSVTFKK